MKNEVEIIVS